MNDGEEVSVKLYERRILCTLESQYELEDAIVTGIANDLRQLASLFERAISGPNSEFRAGRVVVMGLINHTHHLLIGGFHALSVGNTPVWSACVRGLTEIFGACVMITDSPGTVQYFLGDVQAGRLYAAAERGHPGLRGDIKRLHQIAHPGRGAIYAGVSALNEEERTARFSYGLRLPNLDEGREGVVVLGNMAAIIVSRITALIEDGHVLAQGKVIGKS